METDMHEYIQALAKRAQAASRALAALSTAERNAMLEKTALALEAGRPRIEAANAEDYEAAKAPDSKRWSRA